MVSPFYFVIKPLCDKRYDNVRDYDGNDFIISSSQEDHTVTNRFAIVANVPMYYDGDIKPGDTVVVHHNVFRTYYDVRGNERNNWSHYKDNIFLVDESQVFLYKTDDCEWQSPPNYCFIEPLPVEESMILSTDTEQKLTGKVAYVPSNKFNLNKGDKVSFRPESEYEFNIDGKKLYRMRLNSLCLRI
jgi:hypothetical protein